MKKEKRYKAIKELLFQYFNKKKSSGSTDILHMHAFAPQMFLLINIIDNNYVQFFVYCDFLGEIKKFIHFF